MIISSFRRKKTLPFERGGNFIVGHCIILFSFLFFVMFHGPQTWSPMAIKKMQNIYYVYIDFIQYSSLDQN
jgi:hypothetical protein